MSVGDLSSAIDRVLTSLPTPALHEADGYLAEASAVLAAVSTGSSAPELAETVEKLSKVRAELAQLDRACSVAGELLRQYLATIGAGPAAVSSTPARIPPPAPHPAPASKLDAALIAEVRRRGHKISPERVVKIARLPDDRIVWLEEGNEDSGLAHIESAHTLHFERYGIAKSDIASVVFDALINGSYCGTSGADRAVYEISYKGEPKRIAVTVGNNGYIVGANPVKIKRELKQKP